MKLLLCFLLIAPTIALAQTNPPLTITETGYYLTTIGSDGIPSYVQIKTIIDLRSSTPPPPEEPKLDLELINKVQGWSKGIADTQSAQAMASVYAHIRGALEDDTLTPESSWKALKQATDSSLNLVGSKDWSVFRDNLTAEFTQSQQRGNLSSKKQILRAFISVQKGLELSADGSTAITMDQVVEITRRTNLAIDGAKNDAN